MPRVVAADGQLVGRVVGLEVLVRNDAATLTSRLPHPEAHLWRRWDAESPALLDS